MRAQLAVLLASATATFAQTQFTATSAAAVASEAAIANTRSPVSHVKGKAFDRIAIVWLENTDYELAVADPNLAYLATKGITLTNYNAVTHPSEPNYVAAIGGDYFGMDNDNFNFMAQNISTVIDLLEEKGISWGEYQEDMPFSGFEGFAWVNQKTKANDYVRKHNPAIIYNSVTSSSDRIAQIKNLTLFWEDLENETLPQWMFITPNMTSDGHDTSVTVAGQWTRTFMDPLLDNPKFMNNTLVLITFDENSTFAKRNRVLGILLGDAVPSHLVGTTDDSFYNHYSEIATVEANWGLHHLGRWDAGANVFDFVADLTGDVVQPYPAADLAKHFFNSSYDGVFNSAPKNPIYPKPNLCINHNGRLISPVVGRQWYGSKTPSYYSDTIENNDGQNPPAGFNFH